MWDNRRALRTDDQLVPNVEVSQALGRQNVGFLARFYASQEDRTVDFRA
jgi:hypothetical protein